MENPLSRIPNRSDLPKGPSLRQLASQYIPEPVKETERLAEMIGKSAADFAFGEDSGLPFAESLIPGAELVSKVSRGKRPGALDVTDVIPGVGSLKTIGAMGPIVGTLKELKSGGRLGKIARNLEKAKNPYIERWHRTRNINDKNIDAKGLLVGKDNPNYGKNTGDQDRLPIPAAWLGTHPTEIPVLQYYATNLPDQLSTYRVRIPKKEYYNTPRLKWDSGYRGDARDARIVNKGESSLTGEIGRRTGNESLIDLFGGSIPPEWLERIPNSEIEKMGKHAEDMAYYQAEHGTGNETMAEIGNSIVRDQMNSWMPISERYQLFGYRPPTSKDVKSGRRPDELLMSANRRYTQGEGIPKYGMLVDSGDLPDKFAIPPKYYPKEKGIIINNPEAVATGSISRGASLNPGNIWLKDVETRQFHWPLYNTQVAKGATPQRAAYAARPKAALVEDPYTGLSLKHFNQRQDEFSQGSVTRGMLHPNLAGMIRVGDIENDPFALYKVQNPSGLLEYVFTHPGDKWERTRRQIGNLGYTLPRGSIARGMDEVPGWRPKLTEVPKEDVRKEIKRNLTAGDWGDGTQTLRGSVFLKQPIFSTGHIAQGNVDKSLEALKASDARKDFLAKSLAIRNKKNRLIDEYKKGIIGPRGFDAAAPYLARDASDTYNKYLNYIIDKGASKEEVEGLRRRLRDYILGR